eukprot:TRINITY_DN3164_c0_g1_i1.p1 TRINITY_DN3164_c0_g1~~TRINITY_DN3164_c0_g1_i1.p1  ORF type:complete len:458 (-),score=80.97 TRINITY_DN3164_c0_g1_i1:1528-2901(-)
MMHSPLFSFLALGSLFIISAYSSSITFNPTDTNFTETLCTTLAFRFYQCDWTVIFTATDLPQPTIDDDVLLDPSATRNRFQINITTNNVIVNSLVVSTNADVLVTSGGILTTINNAASVEGRYFNVAGVLNVQGTFTAVGDLNIIPGGTATVHTLSAQTGSEVNIGSTLAPANRTAALIIRAGQASFSTGSLSLYANTLLQITEGARVSISSFNDGNGGSIFDVKGEIRLQNASSSLVLEDEGYFTMGDDSILNLVGQGTSLTAIRVINNGGVIQGNGQINGDVINNDSIMPVGSLSIVGNFEHAGIYHCRVASRDLFSKIVVSGSITGNGTLNIILEGTYVPVIGQNFTILSCNMTSSIRFSSITYNDETKGRFLVSYLTKETVITFIGAPNQSTTSAMMTSSSSPSSSTTSTSTSSNTGVSSSTSTSGRTPSNATKLYATYYISCMLLIGIVAFV